MAGVADDKEDDEADDDDEEEDEASHACNTNRRTYLPLGGPGCSSDVALMTLRSEPSSPARSCIMRDLAISARRGSVREDKADAVAAVAAAVAAVAVAAKVAAPLSIVVIIVFAAAIPALDIAPPPPALVATLVLLAELLADPVCIGPVMLCDSLYAGNAFSWASRADAVGLVAGSTLKQLRTIATNDEE
jgi:hypothetical protein